MTRRARAYPAALFDILRKVYPAPEELPAARAFSFWSKAMPERVQLNAQPVRFQRGELYVNVTSASWAQELAMMGPQLLRRLQMHAPSAGVRSIRFQVGPLPDFPLARRRREEPPLGTVIDELPEEIGRELACIDDDALREAVGNAALSALRRQRRQR